MDLEEYQLDKFMKFTNNIAFHEFFGRKEHKELLCTFLSLYFEIPYKDIIENINYLSLDLEIDNLRKYKYGVDLLITFNNDSLVEIEMNNQFWKGLKARNTIYMAKALANEFDSGSTKEDFEDTKPVIQINFNNFNKPKNRDIVIYGLNEKNTPNEYSDILEIHQINLVKIREKKYTDIGKLKSYEKVGLLMSSESIEDVVRICKDVLSEEDLEKVVKRLYELNSDKNLWTLYDKEDLNRQISESKKKEGEAIGKKAGEIIGIKKGSNQKAIEIAKNMLDKNMNIDLISDITGLTIDEINNIK